MSDENKSGTGFSSREAKEFHKYFMLGFLVFTAIAIVAHFLVWQWRPWFPGPEGYAAVSDTVSAFAQSVVTRLT